jgi:hypothetical protein
LTARIRTAAVSLLAIALLGWFLRGANLPVVWGHVRTANVSLLLLALVFVATTFWMRAFRWQQLLGPIGPTRFRTVFRSGVIGFAALSILPARVGDILRPYLVARQDGLPFTSTFATIVMERVLDLIAVLALMAVYVWGFADPSTWPPHLGSRRRRRRRRAARCHVADGIASRADRTAGPFDRSGAAAAGRSTARRAGLVIQFGICRCP